MLVNPNYKAGGGSPSTIPQLAFGVSGGEPYGPDRATSISITTTGHVGEKAIFVVLHREELTVDESWELIDTKSQEWNVSDSGTQYISIYQKIIEADTETYTITTEGYTRKCCYCYYAPANTSLEYERTVSVTKEQLYSVDYAFWYVSNVNQPYFMVVNSPFNLSGEFGIKINSQYPAAYDRPSGFPDARLVCTQIASDVTIARYPYSNSSSNMEQVGVYLYKIGNH